MTPKLITHYFIPFDDSIIRATCRKAGIPVEPWTSRGRDGLRIPVREVHRIRIDIGWEGWPL